MLSSSPGLLSGLLTVKRGKQAIGAPTLPGLFSHGIHLTRRPDAENGQEGFLKERLAATFRPSKSVFIRGSGGIDSSERLGV